MAVKKLDLASPRKKVKRLTIAPIKKVNRFDVNALVLETKELHKPANDEIIEIQLTDSSQLRMVIKPVSALIAQISYEPEGKIWEEEIHAFLWKCENDSGMRFWGSKFSDQVMEIWRNITKEIS